MKINKKGQLLERPFIVIFIVIVSAFIFIFGFYLINNLIKQSNCAQLGLSINDLKQDVDRYYSFDAGSSTDINFKLPSGIKYVCFKNFDEDLDKSELDKIDSTLYSFFNNLNYNIIFTPYGYCTKSFFKIDKIKVNSNPLCALNTGNIKLHLENKGDYVEISKI